MATSASSQPPVARVSRARAHRGARGACSQPARTVSAALATAGRVKPFDRQHPVRASSATPASANRADGHVESKAFHFGIDISAPDGAAVYATTSGTDRLGAERPETIAIRGSNGHVFAYWHIVPAVRNGQQACRVQDARSGTSPKGWGHVHSRRARRRTSYVNPLRRGAMTPYDRHHAADDPHVQLRARGVRASGVRSWQGESTSSPRPGTRRPWLCRGSGPTSRSCPRSCAGGRRPPRFGNTWQGQSTSQGRSRRRACSTASTRPGPVRTMRGGRSIPRAARAELGYVARCRTALICSRWRRSTRGVTGHAGRSRSRLAN